MKSSDLSALGLGSVEWPDGEDAGAWLFLDQDAGGRLGPLRGVLEGSIAYISADDVELEAGDFALLAQVPGCTRFDFDNTAFGDDVAALFAALPLTTLSIGGTEIGNVGFAALARIATLEWLFASRTSVGDAGLAAFRDHDRLEMLALAGTEVTAASATVLGSLPALRELHFTAADDAVLAAAARPHSEFFHFTKASVTATGIDALAPCETLTRFGLAVSELDQPACVAIGQLVAVEELSLRSSTLVEPEIGFALSSLPQLRSLDLARSNVGDESLRSLARATTLEAIDLSGTVVTDEGVKLLAALPQLTRVVTDDTVVTPAAIASLPHLAQPFELG